MQYRSKELCVHAPQSLPQERQPHPPAPSFTQKVTSILTISSLFIVVMTPFAYLGGRAYHDGWYAALRLDPNMFPLDPQGVLVEGAIGWGEVLSTVMDTICHVIAHYWLEAIGILAAIAARFIVSIDGLLTPVDESG
ncbi:hypothetical protein [Dyella sp. A6]|uniref:hypothetical protein n=1 Tax=Dyella aluminiiresistens TaxID=3069105 RepID=UPI002E799A2C|nr:hypothetical protein [Dyella sp. A6]